MMTTLTRARRERHRGLETDPKELPVAWVDESTFRMASKSGIVYETSNTYIRCNIAPVTGKLEVYVVNRDEKEARTPLAQNRILIEFHTIARVVVSPKATDNTTSVFFYLDDRPTLSRKSWKNTTSSSGQYEQVSPEDSFTLMLGRLSCPRANSAKFENQYYAAKSNLCSKKSLLVGLCRCLRS